MKILGSGPTCGERSRTMTARNIFALAFAIALFSAANCKLNKDGNCLNPKAGCFVKDTEAPYIVGTTPASQPTVALPGSVPTLNTLIIDFSEPMSNADNKANYPNPVGGGKYPLDHISHKNK